MTKKKTTKKALLASALSLLLCFSMLLGTTYAWFTDSVTSANNIIKSGNLDVTLEYWDGDSWETVEASEDILTGDLWEPGYVDVAYLRVANAGSLALKYQLGINIVSEKPGVNAEGDSFLLSDYIQFGVVENVNGETGAYATRDAAVAAVTDAKKISAGFSKAASMVSGDELYLALVVYMPTTVDNAANHNGETIPEINLGINVFATQLTSEYDSFGNDYDAMAGGYYHVEYGFNNPSDLLAFAPTAGDAASSGLSINSDGEAQIDASGAWYTVDADLSKQEYVIDYEIDITDLADGENVTVDTGETTAWGSTPIMLERGSTKVYYGLSKNEYIGELEGTVVHVTHTYKYNRDGMLEITTTVSDGDASVSYTKAVASKAQTELYWDIYYATVAGKATMDDFTVKSADAVVDSGAEFVSAIEEVEDGGIVVLADTLTFDAASSTNLNGYNEGVYYEGDKSFTVDLNGKTITNDSAVNDYLMLFKNNGEKASTITFKNGTIEAGPTAYSAICTSTSSTQKITINLENVNVIGNNSNGAVVKVRGGTELNVKAGTVITGKNSYTAIECVSSTANIQEGTEIYQNGTSSYVGSLVGASYNGVVNVYGGYGVSAKGCFVVFTSGGTINVSGGEWIANNDGTPVSSNASVLVAQNDKNTYPSAGKSVINVTGGTFKGGYCCYGNAVGDAQINISAGTFINADPSEYVADGYKATLVGDVYMVLKENTVVVEEDTPIANVDSALLEGKDVVLSTNLTVDTTATTANSGYGATGVTVKGGTLDGNGNSLGINKWGTWDSAVHTTGGTIKNLTVNSGMRGIFMGSADSDVYIDNVVIDGTIYTFNSDGGSKDYGVYISNTTLNGWTSHSDVHKEVVYTNCNFGEGSGYAFCRPYGKTILENCVFEEGFEFDTSKTSDITFINCYYGDTLITAENAATLGYGETTFFYNGLNGITIK